MCVYVWGEVHGHTDASVCMYTNADKCDFSNTAWRKMHGFSSLKCWFDKREMRTLVIFVSPIWILHPKDGRTQREIKKLMGKLKENYNFVHVHVRFDFSTMALWIEAPWKHKTVRADKKTLLSSVPVRLGGCRDAYETEAPLEQSYTRPGHF